jgi:hypothetical protein
VTTEQWEQYENEEQHCRVVEEKCRLEEENKRLKQQLHDILIPNTPPEQEPTEADFIRLFRVLRKAGYPNEES